METISVTRKATIQNPTQLKRSSFTLPGVFGTTWEKLQFNYYAIIVMTLLIGSCVGAIAAANILSSGASTWQLALCASLSMFNNTTAIGNMPVKWVVWSFLIALIGNVMLIAVNL